MAIAMTFDAWNVVTNCIWGGIGSELPNFHFVVSQVQWTYFDKNLLSANRVSCLSFVSA